MVPVVHRLFCGDCGSFDLRVVSLYPRVLRKLVQPLHLTDTLKGTIGSVFRNSSCSSVLPWVSAHVNFRVRSLGPPYAL